MDSVCNWNFPYCSQLSDRPIDWDTLFACFDWLAPLADCAQDPLHHAEGDVLTHTQSVCRQLLALPVWQQLSDLDRSLLFLAALLHDVAKPRCTRIEEGRIVSPAHAKEGARMAERLLYHRWPASLPNVPFAARQAIVALVQLHGLPLWFWQKEDPRRSVIRASCAVRTDLLYLLAKADVLGRICQDQAEMLERVEFFQEFCQEQGCWGIPYPFANPTSRFLYLHKPEREPSYLAYDDSQFTVTLLSGLPGAGKDTWITANRPNLPVISLDKIRQQLHVSPEADQTPVIVQAKDQARHYLRAQQPFVWNATNVTPLLRTPLIELFTAYQARVQLVYLESPWQELLRRNQTRTAQLPESVLDKLADKLQPPGIEEAHEVVWINT